MSTPVAETPLRPLLSLLKGVFVGSDDQDLGLVPAPNPPRPRARWWAAGGFAALVLLLSWRGRIPYFGVLLGTVFTLFTAIALLDRYGTFDDDVAGEQPQHPALAKRLGAFVGAGFAVLFGLWVGSHGLLPPFVAGGLLLLAYLAALYSGHRLLSAVRGALDADDARAPLRSASVWLLAVAGLINLPGLGVMSLWDPWETHYGLVAREILSRDDWITLWSTQEGEPGKWFWSKPVLNFWAQALSMDLLGVNAEADVVLKNAFGNYVARPEWAVRAPGAFLMIGAAYAMFKAVSQVFGKRSGLLAGVVLLTMPDWFMISHQTMADTGFVGALVISMALMLMGLNTAPDMQVTRYSLQLGGRRWSLSLVHVVIGSWLMVTLPQLAYLASRNLQLSKRGIGFAWDMVQRGSPGNCTLPGNQPCENKWPSLVPPEIAARSDLRSGIMHLIRGFEPVIQVLLWAGLLSFVTYLLVGERRTRRLLFAAGWMFAGIATLGKGPAGLVLPVGCVGAYVLVSGRWKELLDFEIPAGISIWATVCLPWFVASYVRNGRAFVERLIIHDMVNRAMSHVHDTNEGVDVSLAYYLQQLGYATFPWVIFIPLAVALVWKHPAFASEQRRASMTYFFLWFTMTFGLFSFMGTKFHHYIFPAVPPLAALVGVALGVVLPAKEDEEQSARFDLFPWLVAAGVLAIAIGADFVHDTIHGQPGAVRLLTLFTYLYNRLWPTHINMTPALGGFVVFFALVAFAMAAPRLRMKATVLFLAGSIVWASWGLDVYMVKLAPHWSQHELFSAYYARRTGPEEPVIAYQMNWLGEYFFSGNHIPAFVTSGKSYTDWIAKQKQAGVKVIFLVAEHSRMTSLHNETGAKSYEEVTSKEVNNKFLLVRAVF